MTALKFAVDKRGLRLYYINRFFDFRSIVMTVLLKEAFEEASKLPEFLQDEVAQELMADIRKKAGKDNDERISWEETYRKMAAEQENWDDFDIALMDGIPGEEFDSRKI